MSAILKALKKLENQTTDGFEAARSGSEMLRERLPGHAAQKVYGSRPIFFAVLVAVFVFLAAGGVWIYKMLPEKPEPRVVVPQDAGIKRAKALQAQAPQPAPMPPQKLSVKPKADPPAPPILSQSSVPVLDQARLPIQKKPRQASPPDSELQVPVKSDAPPVVKPAEDLPILDENPLPPPLMPQRSAQNPVRDTLPPAVLKNSSLRIQAIAWAEDPQRRIAVINGRILHEGEVVDDYFVQNIHPDAIEVKQGDTLWTIEFQIN